MILVRPQLADNIGATARAMLNFGLLELRLVAPRDGWPNDRARAMASRADVVLDNARLYPTAVEATADLHRVYATTARDRDMEKPVLTPRGAAAEGVGVVDGGLKVGFLFGPERAGLENDELTLATSLVSIPTNPGFASLNLAQAVLLLGYEWRLAATADTAPREPAVPEGLASAGAVEAFLQFLAAELDQSGMFGRIEDKRPAMLRNIRTFFHRADITDQEVRTLFGVVRALSGHRQHPNGRPKPQ